MREILGCRACGARALDVVAEFPAMPLANNLCESQQAALEAPRFPLTVVCCAACDLVQLRQAVDPDQVFRHYHYRTAISRGYAAHAADLARRFAPRARTVVDIAGNDGTLLLEFLAVNPDLRAINLDPAQNLAPLSRDLGIETVAGYWPEAELPCALQDVDLFVATNVLGHVADPIAFLAAFRGASPDARILIEVPELTALLAGLEADTIYFEHQIYWAKKPLVDLAQRVGLQCLEITDLMLHGGSTQYLLAPGPPAWWPLKPVRPMPNWWSRVLRERVEPLRAFRGAAFGASAKGNVLLNLAGLDHRHIAYIVDDTPEKQGKFSPGTGIPIVGREQLRREPPEQLLMLAWNWADELKDDPDFAELVVHWP